MSEDTTAQCLKRRWLVVDLRRARETRVAVLVLVALVLVALILPTRAWMKDWIPGMTVSMVQALPDREVVVFPAQVVADVVAARTTCQV